MLQGFEKYVWTGLISVMLLVALWFTGNALYHLYGYLSMSSQTVVESATWSVKEISDERFLLQL